MTPERGEPQEFYVVRDLDQARVLLDPLRLKLLRAFVSSPKTTKQVSEELGEKPTRLYRHVDSLLDSGLLVVKDERRKRGTVERYLQAISRRFAVDPALFAPESPDAGWEVFKSIFETTRREAAQVVRGLDQRAGSDFEPLIAQFRGSATATEYAELRKEILAVIDRCSGNQDGATDGAVGFSGLIALYPSPSEPLGLT